MNVLESLVFCAKYPFTKEAKDYLSSLNIDFSSIGDEALEIAFNRVKASLSRETDAKKKLTHINSSKESYLANEVVSYPLSKIICALNGDFYLRKQFALEESKNVYYFLQMDSDENVLKVADQIFTLKSAENSFSIPVAEYLNCIPDGKEYKLVNSELSEGFVFISKETVAKLISKFVFNSIMETKIDRKKMPKMMLFFAEELSKHSKESLEKIDYGPLNPDNFPPCIKKVIINLKSGEKVGHQPRFLISTFFANIDMPPDKAVDYFREQPNFNEKTTKYHLEHAMGKKGGTKYTAPSCSTIESYGLCFKDSTCRWKHPLVYYKNMKSRRVGK